MELLNLIAEIFDNIETLDRLYAISGGNIRNLLILLYRCLQQEDPPLSRTCLERVIKQYRNELIRAISNGEWELLSKVAELERRSRYLNIGEQSRSPTSGLYP
ncbi:MAG: hypothetical protein F6K31_39345 [Symploca sp. SIO2G7]|nr:hypothetical protein [Symploca sp. SIO2G7]